MHPLRALHCLTVGRECDSQGHGMETGRRERQGDSQRHDGKQNNKCGCLLKLWLTGCNRHTCRTHTHFHTDTHTLLFTHYTYCILAPAHTHTLTHAHTHTRLSLLCTKVLFIPLLSGILPRRLHQSGVCPLYTYLKMTPA